MRHAGAFPADVRPMQQNMAGHFSFLQRVTAGMEVLEGDGWLLVNSGLPTDTFNVLFCRDQPPDAALRDAVGYFRSRQLPFATWIGPESRVASQLEGLGLRQSESETGMVLAPADFRPPALADGLRVERVADTACLARFAGVVAGRPPDASVVRFYESAGPATFGPDSPMRLFVGYSGDEPVATAEAFLSDDAVGVYGVSTLAAYRRRGIGIAMTAVAVREGFEAGKRLGVLQASADGRGTYERLGFRAVGEFRVFQ